MKCGFVRLIALTSLVLCLFASGENSVTHKKKVKRVPAEAPSLTSPSGVNSMAETLHYSFKMETYMGASQVNGSGVAFMMGARFGFSPFFGVRFYVGPELAFLKFSPGSILSTLGAGWYEFRLASDSSFFLSVGAAGGVIFPTGLTSIPTTNYAVLGNLSLYRELNDLGGIGLSVQPGVMANELAILVNFTIQFRFL